MVMGNSENSYASNFAILLRYRKFDAHEIYLFYSIPTSFKAILQLKNAHRLVLLLLILAINIRLIIYYNLLQHVICTLLWCKSLLVPLTISHNSKAFS